MVKPLVKSVVDPVGTARVAKRLASFVGLTTVHLRKVPEDVSQEHMNVLANIWANELVKGMGLRLDIGGSRPDDTGYLLISNHRSYVDIIALLASTPCCFLAKGDVADWPVLGRAAVRAGTVFVERNANDSRKAARDAMAGLLEAGHTVVVFPEGTTFPGPGCNDFRRGSFEVAAEVGAPVLPVAIEYGHPDDAWGDESFVEHFNERFRQPKLGINLHFGPAVDSTDPDTLMTDTRDWIDARLHKLWNELGHK